MSGPDLTAVSAAFGRAAHVILDQPPYVLEDSLSIELADESIRRAAQLMTRDGRLVVSEADHRAKTRGTFVGRARFVEDLVGERLGKGVGQFVILGAGLDTFAQRRPELTQLRIFEVDAPGTQQWKQERLRQLAWPVPPNLRFVPVDFESGDSWVRAISTGGFDLAQPSVIASTGVTQYIGVNAITTTMREAAELASGTTFVCTFVVPIDLMDAGEKDLRVVTEERARGRGCPWISFYSPEQFLAIAAAAGFNDVRYVSTNELNARYFAGRRDGLRATSIEHLITATRTK